MVYQIDIRKAYLYEISNSIDNNVSTYMFQQYNLFVRFFLATHQRELHYIKLILMKSS